MKKILFIAATIVVTTIAYIVLHNIATDIRGYEAVGGEMFVFAVPFLIWAFKRNYIDIKDVIEKRRK